VDDRPENLLALEAILDERELTLVKATSGDEALRLLSETDFAVVLLDVKMDGMSGFETARRIRGQARNRAVPIIFLTAYDTDRRQLEEGYSVGAVDFLTKPLVPVILRAKVASLVQLFQEKEKARRQGELYRLLVEYTTDYAIFMLDPQGRVATWNAGAQRIKGWTAEEIIGRHFSCFYPKEVAERGWPDEELRRATAAGRFEDEGWRVRKDGSRFWANVIITAVRDEHGTLRGFGKVTRDMTERKRAEENSRRLLQEEAARKAAESSMQEARQAQEKERRQREQLHVTLTSIGDAVIVTDRTGAVSFMNPVAVALTGWQPQEAAGQPLERVFHIVNEETRLPVENPVSKVLREGMVVGLANHTVLLSKDGREIPIDDSGAPIRGEDRDIAGVVLVFRDVTEARRAVEARLRLAALVESSEDAIIGYDLAGNITSWNMGATRLYDYTAEEVVGKPLTLLEPPGHPDELPTMLERIKRGEGIEHFETVRVRKDGRRVNVSLTISPVKNAEGKIVGASKIARDITARKRQEVNLRFLAGASKVLAELLDVHSTLQKVARLAVPHFADWCAVDMLEPDGSLRRLAVAHVDPSKVELAHELYRRFPPDPSARQGVWNIIRTGKSEIVPEISDELLAQRVKNPEVLRIIRKLGLRSYMGVPLMVRGEVLGVATFIAAESGRHYDAHDLALAEELAHRSAIAIENARLYSEVREADRRKDEFLATLAHELRNPLAPIRNSLQILNMPRVDPAMAERSREMMERQVQHLVRLVDDLLDVSRVMQGKIELRKQQVELASVVARAVESAQPLIDALGHELTIHLPIESLTLQADPVRLAQVFGNLLTNAAKYTEARGRIWLTTQREGEQAVLRIRDTGIGIAPDMLSRIFDLFVQAEHATNRSQGGLGIGLTLVKNLVEMHHGTVEAHSPGLGKGSEFVVRLPILRKSEAGRMKDESGKDAGSLHPSSFIPQPSGRRLVVVDDNVDAADSLAVLLRLQGHEVHVAHDGPAGLRLAAEHQPEMIFLDIGMPGMDGYEVARRLRHEPGLKNVRLAALTGWGQQEDRRRTAEAGFDYHLVKPVEPKVLEELLAGEKRANK
jgi:PAS domain S-box-containing protein